MIVLKWRFDWLKAKTEVKTGRIIQPRYVASNVGSITSRCSGPDPGDGGNRAYFQRSLHFLFLNTLLKPVC